MQSFTYFTQLAGIIGGMGPEASNYFASLLTKKIGKVTKDQDHIPFLLFNNPQIPDRSQHILYNGENPVPEMVRTGLLLKKAGVTFLVMPCNTSHAFVREVEQGVGLPVLSMVDLTVKYICETYGNDVTVGLLATDGTVQSKIYQKTCKREVPGVSVLIPDTESQKDVMRAIYEIKAHSVNKRNTRLLFNAAIKLKHRGASIIILGCTEIPLALTSDMCTFERIDPMEILADKVIARTLKSKLSIYSELPPLFELPQI